MLLKIQQNRKSIEELEDQMQEIEESIKRNNLEIGNHVTWESTDLVKELKEISNIKGNIGYKQLLKKKTDELQQLIEQVT